MPLPLDGPVEQPEALAFSPSGRTALTGCAGGTARLWDAATGKPIGPALRHNDWVVGAAFSPDGRTLLTGSSDGTARLWPLAEPAGDEAERLVLWVQVMTGLELTGEDVVSELDAATWQRRRVRLQELGGPPE